MGLRGAASPPPAAPASGAPAVGLAELLTDKCAPRQTMKPAGDLGLALAHICAAPDAGGALAVDDALSAAAAAAVLDAAVARLTPGRHPPAPIPCPRPPVLDRRSAVGDLRFSGDGAEAVESWSNFGSARSPAAVTTGRWAYDVRLGSAGIQQLGWATARGAARFTNEEGVGDAPDSYAFDGRRVKKWAGASAPYGEAWAPGDVITCALDLDARTVSFYRNGRPLGVAFSGVRTGHGLAYHPAVSLSYGERVEVNLGREPLAAGPADGYEPLEPPPACATAAAYLVGVIRRLAAAGCGGGCGRVLGCGPAATRAVALLAPDGGVAADLASAVGARLAPLLGQNGGCAPWVAADAVLPALVTLHRTVGGRAPAAAVRLLAGGLPDAERGALLRALLAAIARAARSAPVASPLEPPPAGGAPSPRAAEAVAVARALLADAAVGPVWLASPAWHARAEDLLVLRPPTGADLEAALPHGWWRGTRPSRRSAVDADAHAAEAAALAEAVREVEDQHCGLIADLAAMPVPGCTAGGPRPLAVCAADGRHASSSSLGSSPAASAPPPTPWGVGTPSHTPWEASPAATPRSGSPDARAAARSHPLDAAAGSHRPADARSPAPPAPATRLDEFMAHLLRRNRGATRTVPPPGLSDPATLVSTFFGLLGLARPALAEAARGRGPLARFPAGPLFLQGVGEAGADRYAGLPRLAGGLAHLAATAPPSPCARRAWVDVPRSGAGWGETGLGSGVADVVATVTLVPAAGRRRPAPDGDDGDGTSEGGGVSGEGSGGDGDGTSSSSSRVTAATSSSAEWGTPAGSEAGGMDRGGHLAGSPPPLAPSTATPARRRRPSPAAPSPFGSHPLPLSRSGSESVHWTSASSDGESGSGSGGSGEALSADTASAGATTPTAWAASMEVELAAGASSSGAPSPVAAPAVPGPPTPAAGRPGPPVPPAPPHPTLSPGAAADVVDWLLLLYHAAVSAAFREAGHVSRALGLAAVELQIVENDAARAAAGRFEATGRRWPAHALDAAPPSDLAAHLAIAMEEAVVADPAAAAMRGGLVAMARVAAWHDARLFGERRALDVAGLCAYASRVLTALAPERALFAHVPEFWVEATLDAFHSVRSARAHRAAAWARTAAGVGTGVGGEAVLASPGGGGASPAGPSAPAPAAASPPPAAAAAPPPAAPRRGLSSARAWAQAMQDVVTMAAGLLDDACVAGPDVRELMVQSLAAMTHTARGAAALARNPAARARLVPALLTLFQGRAWVPACHLLAAVAEPAGLAPGPRARCAAGGPLDASLAAALRDPASAAPTLNRAFAMLSWALTEAAASAADADAAPADAGVRRRRVATVELAASLGRLVEFAALRAPGAFLDGSPSAGLNLGRAVETLTFALSSDTGADADLAAPFAGLLAALWGANWRAVGQDPAAVLVDAAPATPLGEVLLSPPSAGLASCLARGAADGWAPLTAASRSATGDPRLVWLDNAARACAAAASCGRAGAGGGPPRADPPDAFLDPITAALMADPVILPSSRKTVDRATLERLLLAPDAADPFTRAPLSRDGVVADAELSARIRAWREGEGGGGGGALAMEE